MKKLNKKRTIIIGVLFLSIFILGLAQNIKSSYAQLQYSNESITVDSNFSILETSDETGNKLNTNSINITLPSLTWNITDLEINFTSIKMGSEINEVESDISGDTENKILDKGKNAYAVQINITEPTTIFGVEIFGHVAIEDDDPLTVEIRGYGEESGDPDAPNSTVYGTTELNISYSLNWYIQTFSNPINLTEGYYYLVINGTNIETKEKGQYWFYLNDPSVKNPDLYSYEYDNGWSQIGPGKVFLHKLNQRLNRSYTPEEDIDMSIEFSGTIYNVTKGANPFTGNVSMPLNNYSPGTENFYLPIRNNLSIELLVNYSYQIKQKNFLSSDASVLIKDEAMNFWSVTPDLVRTDGIYSVQFDFPTTWQNPNVFRDTVNITDNVDIIGNTIFIYNDTISQGAFWNITAYSPNVLFIASIPTDTYGPSQTMIITVTPPSASGNLTFILVDPFDSDIHTDPDPIGGDRFEYTFSSNPFVGQWKAFILWNNQTDAGLQVLPLQVGVVGDGGGSSSSDKTVITGVDPQLIFMTVLYIVIGSLVGLSSYKMVKRHKRAKAEHREKIFNKYMDLLNLDYIMINDKKSGLNVYEQILAGKERDITLITGFLEAIRSFGIELSGSEAESQTIRLQYQNMNIIMNDFKNFRILNVMKEPPSQDFLDSLRPLSHDIETYYGKSLKDFDGNVAKFRGIKDLLEEHLQTSLIYPLKVVMSKETKLNSAEKSLANKALSIMKKNNVDHFFVSYLMGKAKEFNVKNAEIILKLIEKKVFRPID